MAWNGRTSRVAWLVAAVAVLVVGAACGAGGSGGGPGAGGEAPTTGQPRTSGSGEPDQNTFSGDATGAIEVAQAYWKDQFANSGDPLRPVRRIIPYSRAGQVSCGGEAMGRNNAAYCPEGDFIAYDSPWAQRAYKKIGDAFIYYMLDHEYAHGIQVRLGERYSYTIEQELQADCMAGATIGDSIRAKRLKLETGDIEELRRGLIAVADDPGQPWFAPGSHGSAKQRTDAFFAGYNKSLDACKL